MEEALPNDEQELYPRKGRTNAQQLRRMQALAMDVAEERLRNGSASSAEIVYFLKSTSLKEQQELENLRLQGELLQAKAEQLRSERKSNEAYELAMKAFMGYLPTLSDEDDIEDGDFREIDR